MSRVLGHLVEPERGPTKLFRSSSFISIFPKMLFSDFGHNIIQCLIKAFKNKCTPALVFWGNSQVSQYYMQFGNREKSHGETFLTSQWPQWFCLLRAYAGAQGHTLELGARWAVEPVSCAWFFLWVIVWDSSNLFHLSLGSVWVLCPFHFSVTSSSERFTPGPSQCDRADPVLIRKHKRLDLELARSTDTSSLLNVHQLLRLWGPRVWVFSTDSTAWRHGAADLTMPTVQNCRLNC